MTSFHSKGYGRLIAISLFFILIIPNSLAHAQDSNELINKARDMHLHKNRQWHILLHYKPDGPGYKSLIDDPDFFLSPAGKVDPAAELEATLNALFQEKSDDSDHAGCRFIARYKWLKAALNTASVPLPDIRCEEFEKMRDSIRPRSAVLVFPASYMNNPASMFGHTLLRFDSDYKSRLLSYAANYAAYVEDGIGFSYLFKGIFGYYKGYFKVFPYYERVREYNDTEQRDMWEYRLNLTEEEAGRMFEHLWELKDIYSNYYFFDENCSYNLLFLIEAARPSLQLTDKMRPWVIPVDTLRAVKESGVVEDVVFRPAKASRIRHIASLLDEESRQTAAQIADGQTGPGNLNYTNEEKITLLDLAAEMVQYRYNSGSLSGDEYKRLFLSILKERSRLGRPDENLYSVPIPARPEDGHLSARLSLGIGVKDGELFQELRLRPAYHSIADPDNGYQEGSQIVFADTAIRYYSDNGFQIKDIDLIDIISISPRGNFFSPVSWKFKTGFTQTVMPDHEEYIVYRINTGAGIAYRNEAIGLWYVLAQAAANINGGYKDSYAAGIGAHAGIIKNISNKWKLNLSAETMFYGLREWFHEYSAALTGTFKIDRHNSLHLSISGNEIFESRESELKLAWSYYF